MIHYISIPVNHEIELKPVEVGNAKLIFALVEANRDYLGKWLPWIQYNSAPSHTEQFIRNALSKHNRSEMAVYTLWYKNQLAGMIDLQSIDHVNRKAYIGYWLGQQFTRKGIMTLACESLVDTAFDFYNLNRVSIRCATGNHKSCAIPLRLGFTFEGIERQSELLNGKFEDLKVYSMLHSEWKQRKKTP